MLDSEAIYILSADQMIIQSVKHIKMLKLAVK